MVDYQTPGLYFERPRPLSAPVALRTDVAGFVGLAERGPLHTPVRLANWREFQATFGRFLPHAYLAYAVYAFFENGGSACWVVRVADATAAAPAALAIPAADGSDALIVRAIDPGGWGDRLAVGLSETIVAHTRHVALLGLTADQLAVERAADFLPGSRVRLSQQTGAGLVIRAANVAAVNNVTGVLTFDAPLPTELDPATAASPITVEGLAFDVQVLLDNQPVERFGELAYLPQHPRYAPAVVNERSRQVRIEAAAELLSLALPFPLPGQDNRLRGGLDGLSSLDLDDYLGGLTGGGLDSLTHVDEVAVLAMPDLVMRAAAPPPPRRSRRVPIDPCALDAPRTDLALCVTVRDGATKRPLAGAEVTVDDGVVWTSTIPPRTATTDADGRACFVRLLPRDIDVSVAALPGFDDYAERLAAPGAEVEVLLQPRTTPPPLSDDDVFLAQQAMIMQCEQLRDRFAILDAPLNPQGRPRDVAEVRQWRGRYDSQYAALYHPWLIVNDPGAPGGRLILPPSGHVAGVYAAVDLHQGVFRAPANRALAFADNVTLALDDASHGLLNPVGINAIRVFPGRGLRVFGARTLATTIGARYVNERRFLNWLAETLRDGLQWAVFEPMNAELEAMLRLWLTRLLDEQWRRGALSGSSPEAAYAVRVDDTTTTPTDRANGRLIVEVHVAPSIPYEFIVLRLGFTLDELLISEV